MIAVLLALLGGDCHVQRIVAHQYAAQQYVAPVVTTAYAVQYPVFVYAAADTQRLDKLTQIAEQNALLLQQQTQLIQALNVQPAGPQTSKLETASRAILQKSCVSCHRGAKPKGGIDLTGALTTAQKMLCADLIESGAMPPKEAGPPLSNEDFQTVRGWAYEDRAAVRAFLKGSK